MLKEGEFAPKDIKIRDIGGELISLGDLQEEKILVYFYPKDGTPGCTLEAREFQKVLGELRSMNVRLIGVSRDSHESHEKFCSNNNLEFDLWSDVEGDFCNAFGVIVEKNMFGKKFMGIQRSTFLLDADLKVVHVWPRVSPKEHPESVLDLIKGL